MRKPRVVWLPPDIFNRLGSAGGPIGVGTQQALGQIALQVPSGVGNSSTKVVGLVKDRQASLTEIAGSTLSDIENSGYRLRRVVGELFVQAPERPVPDQDIWSDAIITAGIIVLRVNDIGDPLGIGNPDQYSTQIWESASDPWVWRRSWGITSFSQITTTGRFTGAFPSTNAQVAGMNGPHVDAKTARVLGPEERLFLVVSGVALNGTGGEQPLTAEVDITWDLRFLASMRTSMGNRRNASR